MKDTYYFKHDYQSRNDPKIVALRRKFKGEGIAVYWVLTEILHENDDHHLQEKEYLFETISEQSGVDIEKVKAIIDFSTKELELLRVDDLGIYSERVNRNIFDRAELSVIRAAAGSKGGISKSKNVANAKQSEASTEQSVANAKQSEASTEQTVARKGEEKKEKKENYNIKNKKKDSESKEENLSLTNNLDDFGEIFITDSKWLEERAPELGYPASVVLKFSKEFIKNKRKVGHTWTSMGDIRNHFISWFELQPKFGNLKRAI